MTSRVSSTSHNSQYERRVNLSNADRVIDRFIPRASSHQTYRVRSRSTDEAEASSNVIDQSQDSPNNDNSTYEYMSFSLRNEHIIARPLISIPVAESSPSALIPNLNSSLTTGFRRNKSMAEALGIFGDDSRVFQYGYRSSPIRRRRRGRSNNSSQISDVSESELSIPQTRDLEREKNHKIITPYKVLDSQGLKDDFYTNLISWSQKTDNIIVGLNNRAFIWSETNGVTPLIPVSNELITCVSFSSGDYVAVGTEHGRLLLYDQRSQDYLAVAFSEKCLCCITWLADSSGLFTGNETGQVSYYELRNSFDGIGMLRVSSFKYHFQQICGISIANDMMQIAVGCNDNTCSIWDISVKTAPKLQFMLPHTAAVKAIAYCPWSTALLATGGGSKDRTIRFWHSKTGTLLTSLVTKGQITSLIWSPNKKQISATFGFTDSHEPVLISVYSYPKMEVLAQAKANSTLRALSGVASPDGNRICIAVNDESVRFYELWSSKDKNLSPELQEKGIFGSELLELSEDVMGTPSFLR